MNATKKLLLVDPQSLSRLQAPAPASQSQHDLDQAMQGILSMTGISDRDKWTLYNQQLQKYLFRLEESRKPLELPIVEQHSDTNTKTPSLKPDLKDRIANEIPRTYTQKATALYTLLDNSPRIHWDSVGRISIDDSLISDSNLIDLIGDLQRDRKSVEKPRGLNPFLSLIKELNVPHELIGNNKRWQHIQSGSGVGGGAAPGVEPSLGAKIGEAWGPIMKNLKWERILL